MGSRGCRCGVLSWVVPALLLFLLVSTVGAQGLQKSPVQRSLDAQRIIEQGVSILLRRIPLACLEAPRPPREDRVHYISLLRRDAPRHTTSNSQSSVRLFVQIRQQQGKLQPFHRGLPVALQLEPRFHDIPGKAHTEFQDFWKTRSFNNRVDMSFGGGYRTLLNRSILLGVNGFYDTSRLGGTWYSSGSFGFQMAALVGGSDAIDLNFNWYGQLFNSNVIRNAFRYGPSNYDFEAGYSHELWNGGPDLRLKMTGYEFEIGNRVYGWNAGAELKSRDGMFVVKSSGSRQDKPDVPDCRWVRQCGIPGGESVQG